MDIKLQQNEALVVFKNHKSEDRNPTNEIFGKMKNY
jgi:hypothetical protein